MNNYIDSFGRLHDRPVKSDRSPSSNNGFYYTGLAKRHGLSTPLDITYAAKCALNRTRHLHKNEPPIGRDEILGLVTLGFYNQLDMVNWYYGPYPIPKFNLITFTKQAIKAIMNYKDRNYFWQNKLDQIYRFTFSVPLSDRHYILSTLGKYNVFYHIIHILDGWLLPEKRSPRMVRHYKHLDDYESILNYFPEDHPLVSHVKNKYLSK